jgi:hypothetical protein
MIDSTLVRAHQHSAGALKKGNQSIGAAKGGLSPKMHTTVDVLGKTPPGLLSSQAQLVICKVPRFCRFNSLRHVVADKAFDAHEWVFIDQLQ